MHDIDLSNQVIDAVLVHIGLPNDFPRLISKNILQFITINKI